MRRTTPQSRAFAERLIGCERPGESGSDRTVATVLIICTKLHPELASLMGDTGFRATMSRAVALAKLEAPQLGSLRITTGDEQSDLYEYEPGTVAEDAPDGGVVLLAQLLELLAAFIGEGLTERIVRGIWPKLPLSAWSAANGEKHE